jgi:hypothetical protein
LCGWRVQGTGWWRLRVLGSGAMYPPFWFVLMGVVGHHSFIAAGCVDDMTSARFLEDSSLAQQLSAIEWGGNVIGCPGLRCVQIVRMLGWRAVVRLASDPFPQTLWLIAVHASGHPWVHDLRGRRWGRELGSGQSCRRGPYLRLKRPVCQCLKDRLCRAPSGGCMLRYLSMGASHGPRWDAGYVGPETTYRHGVVTAQGNFMPSVWTKSGEVWTPPSQIRGRAWQWCGQYAKAGQPQHPSGEWGCGQAPGRGPGSWPCPRCRAISVSPGAGEAAGAGIRSTVSA